MRRVSVQWFRVRHGLSCVIGPVWPVGAGCYSQAALPMPLSKPLYNANCCFGTSSLTNISVHSTLDVILSVAAVVCVSGIIFVSVAALILASQRVILQRVICTAKDLLYHIKFESRKLCDNDCPSTAIHSSAGASTSSSPWPSLSPSASASTSPSTTPSSSARPPPRGTATGATWAE